MIDDNKELTDMTCDGNCSRCGNCCGLFIPFTEKELDVIKEYVKKNNIKPYDRMNKLTGQFEAHCCFYDANKKECRIYPVRPYVCRDFICSRKDWRKYRDKYEMHGKYNSSLSKKTIMGTFDDLIYDDQYPIIAYLLSLLPYNNGIESEVLVALFRQANRLDLLEYFDAYNDKGEKVNGKELLNRKHF